MNDTTTPPPPGGPTVAPPPPPSEGDSPPGRDRWRSFADARRTTDDRVFAGVCAGMGRQLGIDPIIVRVIVVALTFAGLAGLILYGAAWLLLPTDDGRPSVASDWFRLGRNEPQVRIGGLLVAGVLALMSIVGDTGWLWWGGWGGSSLALLWIAVPALFIYWLAVVLPRRDPARQSPVAASSSAPPQTDPDQPAPPAGVGTTPPPPGPVPPGPVPPGLVPPGPVPPGPVPSPRAMTPPYLLLITSSAVIAVLGGLSLWGEIADNDVQWSTYVVTALMVVGAGLVLGAFRGRSYVLLPIGLVLGVVLALGSAVPNLKVGEFTPSPPTASHVKSTYSFGAGQFTLDLTKVDDPEDLAERSVHVDGGLGQITVLVPEGLPVVVDAKVTGGEIKVFGQQESGHNADLQVSSGDGPALILDIDHTLGQILVERS